MSHLNAFQPIWPPFQGDRFDLQPEVRQARRIFRSQMARLRALAARAVDSAAGAETHQTSQEMAGLLHNISGTAAYFDEAGFGAFAGTIEQPVRTAFTAKLLRPLCEQILAQLDPEAPH